MKTLKTKKFLSKGDVLGQQINFSIEGRDRYSTIPGCFLSTVMFTILAIALYNFGAELFDQKNPDVTYQFSKEKEYPEVDLMANQLLPVLSLMLPYSTDPLPKTEILNHIHLRVKVRIGEMVLLPSGEMEYQWKYVAYEGVPCDEKKLESLMSVLKENPSDLDAYLKTTICPNITAGWEIGGKLTNPPYKTVLYEVFPCVYDGDPSECEDLKPGSTLQVSNFESALDFNNYKNPHYKVVSFDRSIGIGPGLRPLKSNKFKRVVLNDITNDFFDPIERENYFDFGAFYSTVFERTPASTKCSRADLDAGICKPIFVYLLKPSGDTDTYTRKYPTFLEVAGNIGGFADIVVFIFALIYGFYNSRKLDYFLKKKIWKSDSKEIKKIFKKGANLNLEDEIMSSETYIENVVMGKFLEKFLITEEEKVLLPFALTNLKNQKKKNFEAKEAFSMEEIAKIYENVRKKPEENLLRECFKMFLLESCPEMIKSDLKNIKQKKEEEKKADLVGDGSSNNKKLDKVVTKEKIKQNKVGIVVEKETRNKLSISLEIE